jgi:hypothetical protein
MASTKTHETAGELHDKHAPRPEAFSSYQRAIYSALRPPLFSVDPTKVCTYLVVRRAPR